MSFYTIASVGKALRNGVMQGAEQEPVPYLCRLCVCVCVCLRARVCVCVRVLYVVCVVLDYPLCR